MRRGDDLLCRADKRRTELFGQRDARAALNGIDYVEVSPDQRSLCVHFFGEVPDVFDVHHPEGLKAANVRLEGGQRIRDLQVRRLEKEVSRDPERDDCLRVYLDKPGDFSTYRLCLMEKVRREPERAPDPRRSPNEAVARHDEDTYWAPYHGFDPRYACVDFSFKVDCPSDLDCRPAAVCAPPDRIEPEINYLAKDYASFRQLMLDRLALTAPDWVERHAPDLGIALVELLAYAGDHLSYYQDAVATEAYLDTARQRISVRRHARLVDYTLHEGLNARAWVSVWVDHDSPPVRPRDFYFITGFPEIKSPYGNLVKAEDLTSVPASRYEAFEPVSERDDVPVQFFAAHSEIRFYTWGDTECCLPKGATRATLVDARLQVLDVLIFEEITGPRTGNPADADPSHRHAVRLTSVKPVVDALLDQRTLLEIEWASEDALPFALCLSARLPAPDCSYIEDVSVARGNVVLVDHGRSVDEDCGTVGTRETLGDCACEGSMIETTAVPESFTPVLRQTPLAFTDPIIPLASASQMSKRDVRRGLPAARLMGVSSTEGDSIDENDPRWQWVPQTHLLESQGVDQHFVAEIDDDGRAHLRFGDGDLGRRPPAEMAFHAYYRVGNGPAGNVGRETISYLVLRTAMWSGITVKPRNPLAAQGGVAPEPIAEAKLFAPHAFRSQLRRAITAGDYRQILVRRGGIADAAGALRWTGSWYEARVAIDPAHLERADETLLSDAETALRPYRRMGHDLDAVEAVYVPLDIEMRVCVLPHHARGAVKGALLDVFSNQTLPDGQTGFFHPDRFTFGGGVYLSRLVATAQAVAGVASVEVTKLQRLHHPARGEREDGVLPIAEMEIAQLANDANFPERGQLSFIMEGGR